jgi:gamma-glutamylcyclotransferase (GGCT)/AIG2-like uncharacterized protein YtfP
MFKVEGQCINCENMAVDEILDETMVEYVTVCDECFKDVFTNVTNSGADVFLEWAEEMYGTDKAIGLTREIFGDSAVYYLVGDDYMSKKRKNREDEKMVTMFTYGILKYPNNIKREGGINIIENSILRGHKMHLYNSSFPITRMTNNTNDVIYGTLFEVPESQVLYSYDFTEGYNPKAHPSQNMYNRIEVEIETPTGEKKLAQFYYANQRQFAEHLNKRTLIPTGNFNDRHLAQSFNWKRR